MDATESSRRVGGLDEMTVGAPRSAREALQSGAISLEALRAAHRMRDGRSALDVLGTLASFVAVPMLFGLHPRWWTFALLALCAIRNFNCAAQLVHESDHGTLFRDPRLNRRPGESLRVPAGLYPFRSSDRPHGPPPLSQHRPGSGHHLQPAERVVGGGASRLAGRPAPRLRDQAAAPVLPVGSGHLLGVAVATVSPPRYFVADGRGRWYRSRSPRSCSWVDLHRGRRAVGVPAAARPADHDPLSAPDPRPVDRRARLRGGLPPALPRRRG